jgi:hypothetical protein
MPSQPPTAITTTMEHGTNRLILFISIVIHLAPSPGSSFYALRIPQQQHHPRNAATPTFVATALKSSSKGTVGEDEEDSQTQRRKTSGRRMSSDRPRRPPPSSITKSRDRTTSTTTSTVTERRRAPHQFDHTKADARPFLNIDAGTYTRTQNPNENAPVYMFNDDDAAPDPNTAKLIAPNSHVQSTSLDALFPNLDFSFHFNTNSTFRNAIRNSIREDIFDTSSAYANMSEKARRMLLLPDSSLQGSWSCDSTTYTTTTNDEDINGDAIGGDKNNLLRMKRLTEVLVAHLGPNAPNGDRFMTTIGDLCGSQPSTHWIDIVGIMDRKISYSWHQDTGRSKGGDSRTVLLGFPREDNYDGTGVFSHAVKLMYERHAPIDHPINEPIVYPKLVVEDEFVVKPRYTVGQEIVMFRDVDVLHSAPEVAYRASVMGFM